MKHPKWTLEEALLREIKSENRHVFLRKYAQRKSLLIVIAVITVLVATLFIA